MSRHCSIWTSTQRVAKRWNCEGFDFHGRLFCLFETQSLRFRFDSMLFTKWVFVRLCQDVGNSLDTCSENAAEHLSIVAKLPFLQPFGVTCSQLMQVTVTVFFCEQKKNTKIRTMKSCLFFFHFFSHVNLFFAELGLFLCKPSFETSWILWQRTSMKETGIVST